MDRLGCVRWLAVALRLRPLVLCSPSSFFGDRCLIILGRHQHSLPRPRQLRNLVLEAVEELFRQTNAAAAGHPIPESELRFSAKGRLLGDSVSVAWGCGLRNAKARILNRQRAHTHTRARSRTHLFRSDLEMISHPPTPQPSSVFVLLSIAELKELIKMAEESGVMTRDANGNLGYTIKGDGLRPSSNLGAAAARGAGPSGGGGANSGAKAAQTDAPTPPPASKGDEVGRLDLVCMHWWWCRLFLWSLLTPPPFLPFGIVPAAGSDGRRGAPP